CSIFASHHSDRSPLSRPSFLHATTTTQIYALSLHDALPIFTFDDDASSSELPPAVVFDPGAGHTVDNIVVALPDAGVLFGGCLRSEEHTSELQSRENLVCRLLLEKKNSNAAASTTRIHDQRS